MLASKNIFRESVNDITSKFLSFVNETGSPYHTVEGVKNILKQYKKVEVIEERNLWKLERCTYYIVTRNSSSVCAFYIGKDFHPDNGGFSIAAAHTDSPCLRIRPNNNVQKENYSQCGVECYGGGLWHTWFDRGLGFAGKVVVKDKDKGLTEKLVRVARPIAILPNLAIHLRTAEEISAFQFNKETHLQPILCSEIFTQLIEDTNSDMQEDTKDVRFSPPLVKLISEELAVAMDDIVEFDLCLMDATPSRLCGVNSEFIESPRLDNNVSTFAIFQAFATTLCDEKSVSIAASFDHEEVGSESFVGADSSMMQTWLERILQSLGCKDRMPEIISRSFLMSSDMAHAIHPNYVDKHQQQHKPMLHKGIVLKENSNQRYSTGCNSMALTRMIAQRAGVPLQYFVVRNDSRCGSTIAPMLSSRLGVRTADIGVPQLAMHSCRETCGIVDILHMVNLIQSFFTSFRNIDDGLCIW